MNEDETRKWVLNARLDRLEEVVGELDSTIRGDSSNQIGGLVARMHELETYVSRLNAIIFVDSTGKKGLLHDVHDLKEGREDRRSKWGNWTKIIVAAITSGAITYFWPQIKTAFVGARQDVIGKQIENVKHPKPRHRHVVIVTHKEPEEGSTDDQLHDRESESEK